MHMQLLVSAYHFAVVWNPNNRPFLCMLGWVFLVPSSSIKQKQFVYLQGTLHNSVCKDCDGGSLAGATVLVTA